MEPNLPPELDIVYYRETNKNLEFMSGSALQQHWQACGRAERRTRSITALREYFVLLCRFEESVPVPRHLASGSPPSSVRATTGSSPARLVSLTPSRRSPTTPSSPTTSPSSTKPARRHGCAGTIRLSRSTGCLRRSTSRPRSRFAAAGRN